MDSLYLNTPTVPTIFAFVSDDLEKEKERLKEELFDLKIKLPEIEQEHEKLKNNNFCDLYSQFFRSREKWRKYNTLQ